MKFDSKRNVVEIVTYNDKQVVRKIFTFEEDCLRERSFYENMSEKLPMPGLLETGSDFLIVEYIPSKNLCEVLEEQTRLGYDETPWSALLHWISDCCKMSGMIPTDGNLRNFLWDGNTKTLYGIDFEQYDRGTVEMAYAHILVQLPTYRGINQDIVDRITDLFPKVSHDAYNIAMNAMCIRRGRCY